MISVMLPSLRLKLHSPGRMCTVLPNGVRHLVHFKSLQNADENIGSLEDRLRRVFDNSMKNSKIPLFSEWNSYAKSLPRRTLGDISPYLYKLPYWADNKDVLYLANMLFSKATKHKFLPRGKVSYLAAPTQYGKTASVLPAFLKGAEDGLFTHYMYLPFNNNVGKFFRTRGKINEDEEVAEAQGAAFMLECFKKILNIDENQVVKVDENPPSLDESKKELKNLFNDFVKEKKILVHLDEHREMCPSSVAFRKGAFYLLAGPGAVRVVATYTNKPPLKPHLSSEVCRVPLPVPPVDLDLLAKDVKELKLPHYEKNNAVERRLFGTLRICLGIMLTSGIGLGSIQRYIISRDENPNLHISESKLGSFQEDNIKEDYNKDQYSVLEFLKGFEEAANNGVRNALIKCQNEMVIECLSEVNENAVSLLLGIKEKNLSNEVERQIPEMVVCGDIVTSSIPSLLSLNDPSFSIYSLGSLRFRAVITRRKPVDYFSQTPLEAAYSWVLSCVSAKKGKLIMGKKVWFIKCDNLRPHRLFEKHNTTDYVDNYEKMKCNTIYYVSEGKGCDTHPLCDIFFRTEENDLVLINVTSGGERAVKDRIEKLSTWIQREGKMIPDVTLHGVVLAPMFHPAINPGDEFCECVCGVEAQNLLGGLQQILWWLPLPNEL